jgi:uncharacterized protein YceH (UPF0502 family)
VDLTAPEVRVLGCLLEKQRMTPEAYPLSLNALRLACNQSTNREPVVQYDEATIRDALHRLSRRRWTRLASGPGSRAPKYRHLLDEALGLPNDEVALLCLLMLRGPQTPGELKQRSGRLHPFADLGAIHATLERLIERDLAVRHERRPGQKEERYGHRLSDDAAHPEAGPVAAAASAPSRPTPTTVPRPRCRRSSPPSGPTPPTSSSSPRASTRPSPSSPTSTTPSGSGPASRRRRRSWAASRWAR